MPGSTDPPLPASETPHRKQSPPPLRPGTCTHFEQLAELPRTRRAEELGGLDDEERRAKLDRLLEAHDRAPGFLEGSADELLKGGARAQVGQQWGPYLIKEVIGEGGMGVVFRARDQEWPGHQVAIKMISSSPESERVVQRFEREARVMARMDHPNIARLIEFARSPAGVPYLVMEWVDGIPIDRYCTERQLPLRERLNLFRTLCQAIRHAQLKGVIHRDIKPSNVLVTEAYGAPLIKLIDFGVAKPLYGEHPLPAPGEAGSPIAMSVSGTIGGSRMGTPGYMSPEQAAGERVDLHSDVYSLGAVLYELLCGVPPCDRETMEQDAAMGRPARPVLHAAQVRYPLHWHEALREHSEESLRSILRGKLGKIVMRALEPDPARRHGDPLELVKDIESWLDPGKPSGRQRRVRQPRGPDFSDYMPVEIRVVVIFALIAIAVLAWVLSREDGDSSRLDQIEEWRDAHPRRW